MEYSNIFNNFIHFDVRLTLAADLRIVDVHIGTETLVISCVLHTGRVVAFTRILSARHVD